MMLNRKSSVRSLKNKGIFLVSLQLHKISLHWGYYSKISSPAKEAMKKSEEQFLMPGDISGVLRAARAMRLQIQGGH